MCTTGQPPGERVPACGSSTALLTLVTTSVTEQVGVPGHTADAISLLAALLDEGLWDMFVKDIPRSATSYTVGLDKLRQGVTYEFRVVAVNEFGYGEPSVPSVAVSGNHGFFFKSLFQWNFLRFREKRGKRNKPDSLVAANNQGQLLFTCFRIKLE